MDPSEAQVGRVMERYSAEGRVTDVARLHDSMKLGELFPPQVLLMSGDVLIS